MHRRIVCCVLTHENPLFQTTQRWSALQEIIFVCDTRQFSETCFTKWFVFFWHNYCKATFEIRCALIHSRLPMIELLISHANCSETFNSSRWLASNYICSLQPLWGPAFQLLQGSYRLRVVSCFRKLQAHSPRHHINTILLFLRWSDNGERIGVYKGHTGAVFHCDVTRKL